MKTLAHGVRILGEGHRMLETPKHYAVLGSARGIGSPLQLPPVPASVYRATACCTDAADAPETAAGETPNSS